ncbi:MAG: beta-ketoacyl synthase chain length factor [Treponema sp.]|nr:beta-ketoacyl synthase chain length factor [Treponema sp.]
MKGLYISKPSCWAPGISSSQDWAEWKNGAKSILCTEDTPPLSFTTPIFKRRLSQLSKMTIQVVHDAIETSPCKDIKQAFISMRGEIKREFTINEKLIKEHEVSPSAFSLSVFNAPIALASIACKLKGGYSVIFPSDGNFYNALTAACAPVLCDDEKDMLLVYADELVPECYGTLRPENNEPFAFAAVISSEKRDSTYAELKLQEITEKETFSPADFLRGIL